MRNWSRVRDVALAVGLVALLAGGGCSGDACAELADQCAVCPLEGLGLLARDSCLRTVDIADELACEDRLDIGIYLSFGCR